MASTSGKDPNKNNSKESETISSSKVAYSDPQMIEISLHEIRSFLITENIAKVVMFIGSFLVGGVISAVISKISVNPIIIIVSLAIFVFGITLDVYLTITKLKELEKKGAGKWK